MISDTLHDAVSELDAYLVEGSGSAWNGHPWHAEILDVRHRMETLRCKLDGDDACKSFREIAGQAESTQEATGRDD